MILYCVWCGFDRIRLEFKIRNKYFVLEIDIWFLSSRFIRNINFEILLGVGKKVKFEDVGLK